MNFSYRDAAIAFADMLKQPMAELATNLENARRPLPHDAVQQRPGALAVSNPSAPGCTDTGEA